MFGVSKKIIADAQAIKSLLTRGVEDVFVKESLERRLNSNKPLRVKLGFDPTGPNIHIGRAIILRKLREFQDLGHTAVFVVGDFTARVGDPSDKLEKRPMLSKELIQKNLATYKAQVGKILDLRHAEFHFNSRWLSKLTFTEIAELAESFSVQQMSARRNFSERAGQGEEISLREFLYPLMQGYDSVAVRADVEIGGFDQLFNLKAGRIVQRHYKQPEQDVLTTEMLEGSDGRKMSTSWGNVININDTADEMFGKTMSIRDDLIGKYFSLCTDVPEEDIARFDEGMKTGGLNPRDIKIKLATALVTLYHGAPTAKKAVENFDKTFTKGGIPTDILEVRTEKGSSLSDVLVSAGVVSSKSEFRRLIKAGAISALGGSVITNERALVGQQLELRIGKHRFVRIKI